MPRRVSVVRTSSPSSPSSSTSPVTGSTTSGQKWSSQMCGPSFVSMHSHATPGPITSERPNMSMACMSRRSSSSRAHVVGPRLGAEDPDLQRRGARVDALALHLVDDRQHVRGRDRDDLGLEVADQEHLPLRHPAGHGDHRAPETLGARVGPESAGEQAVAVGVVHHGRLGGRRTRASSGRRATPRCRDRPPSSRRPSADRSCRTRRGCGRSPGAARRTCRTGTARAGRPWW